MYNLAVAFCDVIQTFRIYIVPWGVQHSIAYILLILYNVIYNYIIICTLHRYYIGQQGYIIVSDLDMLKQILVKDFDNFSDHSVS